MKKSADRLGNMHSDQFVFKHVASYFLQTLCCLVGIISLGTQKHNKYNLHIFILYTDVIISYSFKTARYPGEKQTEKQGVLGATIFFTLLLWLTEPYIAHGHLCMRIMCDLDLGRLRFCWSTVHAYYAILSKKFSRLKISLPLLFQTSKGHIKYTIAFAKTQIKILFSSWPNH